MDDPPTAAEYKCMVAAAEAASELPSTPLSPNVYLEDLLLQQHEETEVVNRLLKAAEEEYHPLRALSPTEYYDNCLSYESDEEPELIGLAEDEEGESSLLLTPLSPKVYYEAMASENTEEPASAPLLQMASENTEEPASAPPLQGFILSMLTNPVAEPQFLLFGVHKHTANHGESLRVYPRTTAATEGDVICNQ